MDDDQRREIVRLGEKISELNSERDSLLDLLGEFDRLGACMAIDRRGPLGSSSKESLKFLTNPRVQQAALLASAHCVRGAIEEIDKQLAAMPFPSAPDQPARSRQAAAHSTRDADSGQEVQSNG